MEKLAEILKERLSKYTPEELEALFDKYDQFDGPTIDDNINDPCEPILNVAIKPYQIPEKLNEGKNL